MSTSLEFVLISFYLTVKLSNMKLRSVKGDFTHIHTHKMVDQNGRNPIQ